MLLTTEISKWNKNQGSKQRKELLYYQTWNISFTGKLRLFGLLIKNEQAMDILHFNEECEPRGEGPFVCSSCRRKLLKNEIVKNRFGERLCEKNASVVFLLKGNILMTFY